MQASFGQHAWQLPRCQRVHPDAGARAGGLAAALLAGRLLPGWSSLVPALAEKAATAAAPHARHLPCVSELLAALMSKQVQSCPEARPYPESRNRFRFRIGASTN